MSKEINLLPDITLHEEQQSKKQKLLTATSMAILVLGAIALVVVFTMNVLAHNEYNKIVDINKGYRSQLSTLATVDLTQRHIKSKLEAATTIVNTSKDYKAILENIESITPDGITIADISLDKSNKLVMNVKATNTEIFQQYVRDILNNDKGGKYFKDVIMSNVSSTKEGLLQFNLTMTLIQEKKK